MYCRRCCSPHLLRLEKKLPQDNQVFRCQECGFLFSPSGLAQTPIHRGGGPEAGSAMGEAINPLCSGPGATGGAGPPLLPRREGLVQPRE